jgi:sulfotransferase family protein
MTPRTTTSPRGPATAKLPTLVYVGGYGRSGSTLIGRVLGEPANAICIGETRYLLSRGLLQDVECGCGSAFSACRFWAEIGDAAFGGWDRAEAGRLLEIDRAVASLRTLPLHWAPSLRPQFSRAVGEYAAWLTRLYAAMRLVSGADVVIDTSKEPQFASILTRIDGLDLRFVHLVRDSRAVAYSWLRKKRMPSPIGEEAFMPRFPAADTAPKWVIWNLAFHALSRRYPYARVNYEDFVGSPRAALTRIGGVTGAPEPPESAVAATKVSLGDHHIFSGNPMRAQSGWIELRCDDEWQFRQPARQFVGVTAATWPLLRRYGYPTIPPGRRR